MHGETPVEAAHHTEVGQAINLPALTDQPGQAEPDDGDGHRGPGAPVSRPPETTGAAPALPRLLRAHVAGLLADTAAVELLIEHRHWLRRPGFTDRFVHSVTTTTGAAQTQTGAWIRLAARRGRTR